MYNEIPCFIKQYLIKMYKKNYFKLSIHILFFIFSFTFLSCKSKPEQTSVELKDITESVYASGIVKSKNQYQVFSKVNGIIEELFVKEGDLIKKGQTILKIANLSGQINSENAALAVKNTDYNANIDKISDLGIAVDMAHKKLKNDSLLWQRQINLWNQQVGTKVELEQRELAFLNSKIAYQSAIYKFKELKRQINFASAQSKKLLEMNRTLEADYFLKSEYDGRIYNLLKEKGEMVNPLNSVALIGDANDFILELQVDENDVVRIVIGQKVFVSLDSYKGEVFEAKVEEIEPIMNEKTRTFIVKASFLKKPKVLYPNLTVEANIVIITKEKALTIPRNYLIDDSYVLNENNEKIKVQIGLKDYETVEILSGLKTNDVILKPLK